jgi:CheY-like chemotaxis protein
MARSAPKHDRQYGGENARDAMSQGGKLVIETRNIVLDADHTDFHPELQPGEYVQLSVSDTGSGMPPQVCDRVFEPFFTTKEKGRGTGLGLAMVYGFVKQSGGHIAIYSEVGHGTTFNLYFPRADGAVAGVPAKTEHISDPMAHETILVVEDDERVRKLTIKRLKLIGYEVLEASDGPKALDILTRGQSVDLVLTDLVMPGGISGREVAARARELKPNIKILLTSGYAEELVHAEDLERLAFACCANRIAKLIWSACSGKCWSEARAESSSLWWSLVPNLCCTYGAIQIRSPKTPRGESSQPHNPYLWAPRRGIGGPPAEPMQSCRDQMVTSRGSDLLGYRSRFEPWR